MHYLQIARLLGLLLVALGGCMATSLVWTVLDGVPHATRAFLISAGITVSCGGALWALGRRERGTLFRADALLLVALSWMALGVFGALPYMLEGAFINPADAYFENVSGFTTTGSTVMLDIASHSRGLLWWRALTHWLGGMGIIVLFVAIFPQLGVGGKLLFKSEVPGPITEGLQPKIKQTAAMLWRIYLTMTLALIALLWALGMPLFDAITHAFSTLATGGLSPRNGSVGEFNSASIDAVTTLFMLLGGVNFTLYYGVLRGHYKRALMDRELWAYLGIITVVTLIVTANIVGMDARHSSALTSFRYASFQVVAIITSTGFCTDDYNLYPPMSKLLLVLLMFFGGMAGSTAGGMKIIRLLIICKAIYVEIYKVFRPQSVMTVRIGRAVISQEALSACLAYFAMALFTCAGASLYLTYLGLDLVTAVTASLASIFNIGPGLATVGPTQSFAHIPTSGKVVLSLCMILGRLEFMTLLVLCLPDFWRR